MLTSRRNLSWISTGVLGAAWALLSYSGVVPSYFLATPSDVAESLLSMLVNEGFLVDVSTSVVRITVGFLASALVAVPVGVLIGRSEAVDGLLTPLLSFVRYLPVPALLPLCILWFGVGEVEKIVVVFIGVFFQLVFLIADVTRSVPVELVEVAKTMGLGRRGLLLKTVIPYSAPGYFDHLRVTFGWAWGWVMLAELVGASRGIGFVIIRAQRFLLTSNMFAALLVLGLLGVLTDLGLARLGERLFPWRERESRR